CHSTSLEEEWNIEEKKTLWRYLSSLKLSDEIHNKIAENLYYERYNVVLETLEIPRKCQRRPLPACIEIKEQEFVKMPDEKEEALFREKKSKIKIPRNWHELDEYKLYKTWFRCFDEKLDTPKFNDCKGSGLGGTLARAQERQG